MEFHTTEDLFGALSTSEIRRVVLTTSAEAMSRGESLKALVGDRYGDLIGTADEAAEMYRGVRELESRINELRRAAREAILGGAAVEVPQPQLVAAPAMPSASTPYESVHECLDRSLCWRALRILEAALESSPDAVDLASSRGAILAVARGAIAQALVVPRDALSTEAIAPSTSHVLNYGMDAAISGVAAILASAHTAADDVGRDLAEVLLCPADAVIKRAADGSEPLPDRVHLAIGALSCVARVGAALLCKSSQSNGPLLARALSTASSGQAVPPPSSVWGEEVLTNESRVQLSPSSIDAPTCLDGVELRDVPQSTRGFDAAMETLSSWIADAALRVSKWLPQAISDWLSSASPENALASLAALSASLAATPDGPAALRAAQLLGAQLGPGGPSAAPTTLGAVITASALSAARRDTEHLALSHRLRDLAVKTLRAVDAAGVAARAGPLHIYSATSNSTIPARGSLAARAAAVRRKIDALHAAAGRAGNAGGALPPLPSDPLEAFDPEEKSPAAAASFATLASSSLPEYLASGSGAGMTAAALAVLVAAGALTVAEGGSVSSASTPGHSTGGTLLPTAVMRESWGGTGDLLSAMVSSFPAASGDGGALVLYLAPRAAEDAARAAGWTSPLGSSLELVAALTASRAGEALGAWDVGASSLDAADDAARRNHASIEFSKFVEVTLDEPSRRLAAVAVEAATSGDAASSRALPAAYSAFLTGLCAAALLPVAARARLPAATAESVAATLTSTARRCIGSWASIVGAHAAAAAAVSWPRAGSHQCVSGTLWRHMYGSWVSVSVPGAAPGERGSAALSSSDGAPSLAPSRADQALAVPLGVSDALAHTFSRASAHVQMSGVSDTRRAPASRTSLQVGKDVIVIDDFGIPISKTQGTLAMRTADSPSIIAARALALASTAAVDEARALARAAVSSELRRSLAHTYAGITDSLLAYIEHATATPSAESQTSASDMASIMTTPGPVDTSPLLQAVTDVLAWGHALPDLEAVPSQGSPAGSSLSFWVAGAPRASALFGGANPLAKAAAPATPSDLAARLADGIDAVDFSLCGPALLSAAGAALRAHALVWSPALPPLAAQVSLGGGLILRSPAVALSTTPAVLRRLGITWRLEDVIAIGTDSSTNATGTNAATSASTTLLLRTPLPVPLSPEMSADNSSSTVHYLSPPIVPAPARLAVPAPPAVGSASGGSAAAMLLIGSSSTGAGALARLCGSGDSTGLPTELAELLAPPQVATVASDHVVDEAEEEILAAPLSEAKSSAVAAGVAGVLRGAGGALLGMRNAARELLSTVASM